MPVNPFFNNYKNRQEQSLVEDLINESINMMGFDGYYIPNSNEQSRDLIYGEDPLKKFDDAYVVTVYLSNSVDPGMNNDFFSKFGLEIKNNVRVQLSRREFSKKVSPDISNRPKEGALLYIPFLSGVGELYEIKYVNDSTDFFTLGRKQPYYWELELELFKYSNEEIDTGIEEIDFVNRTDPYSIEYTMTTGTGQYMLSENVYQGASLATSTASGVVQGWDGTNLILKISNIAGTFSNTSVIIGDMSDARYSILNFDHMNKPSKENAWDNKIIETESSGLIDTSETNPFGTL